MYQKSPQAFMADWSDADGRRHRKQFSTAKAALEHEHRETALTHAVRASRAMTLAEGGKKPAAAVTESATMAEIQPAKG